MKQPKYCIYPSLLDKFQKYLDSELEVESFWNINSEGDYKLSADEISDKNERELIDMINRVPREPIAAADKGTAFNEIVDCLIENRGSNREDLKIESIKGDNIPIGIRAQIHGFVFDFDISICKEVATYCNGAICQLFTSAEIETSYGIVKLYGYIDELIRNKVIDIKTTSYYEFGKFESSWQKEIYPYCLIKSGECTEVAEFEYTVIKLKGGTSMTPLISGEMYKEPYTYNHERTTIKLRQVLELFIHWLESNRNKITDKKIFGDVSNQ
ncbi:MAG: HNH endonuclease [Bacteroides sp.]